MNDAPKHIVILHGLERVSFLTRPLGRALRKKGYTIHYFDYRSHSFSVAEVVEQLQDFVHERGLTHWAGIGYSLGGVILWNSLAGGWRSPPTHLVFLGSPLAGAKLARLVRRVPLSTLIFGPALSDLARDHRALSREFSPKMLSIAGLSGSKYLYNPFLGEENDGLVRCSETNAGESVHHHSVRAFHPALVLTRRCAEPIEAFLKEKKETAG